MLAADCKALLELLSSLDEARDIERVCESLDSRQQDLLAVKEVVDQADSIYLAISKRETFRGKIDGTKALKYASDLRESLAKDPESISQGRGFTNLKSAFTKLAETMTACCSETWAAHCARVKPRVDAEQVQQAKQAGHSHDAERLEQLVAISKRLSSQIPLSEEAFVELESKWEEMRKLVNKLPAPTKNPEIQAFLKAVNSLEGASLDLLTDQVKAWLVGNPMAKKLRVRPA